MTTITLEDLIQEGTEIKNRISYIESDGFVDYKITDTAKYERWKNKVIRFLEVSFPDDRCITDFETAIFDFDDAHNSPKIFDRLIGILESCVLIPAISHPNDSQISPIDKSINIHVNQSQNQSQEQLQNMAIKIFTEAIKDELTGKQVKEIKGIFTEEPDPKKARTKIFDKIKSFGSDVASNVLANILTNPAIWGNL